RTAHAVGVLRVRIGTADDAQEQSIARLAGNACRFRQAFEPEENALAGAAAHVGGGNAELWFVCHGLLVSSMLLKNTLSPDPSPSRERGGRGRSVIVGFWRCEFGSASCRGRH